MTATRKPKGKRSATMSVVRAKGVLLADRKARALAALQKDLTLGVEDTALVLGLSRNHVYDLVVEGKAPFPFFKAGRSIRIPTAALRAMLKVDEAAA